MVTTKRSKGRPRSMMVAACAMHVAVVEFFLGGVADRDDFYVEVEGLAGQRVVGVDLDRVLLDANDFDET